MQVLQAGDPGGVDLKKGDCLTGLSGTVPRRGKLDRSTWIVCLNGCKNLIR